VPRLVPDTGPQRVMAASDLVNTFGGGLYLTAGVLYFTQDADLPTAQVGLGLGVAGVVALFAGIGCGHLADRRGARGVYVVTVVIRAAATAGFLLAHHFWIFLIMVCLAGGAQAAGLAARSPLIRSHGGDRPQEFRAYLRSVTNVGISFGSLLAGWIVAVGTHSAYSLLIIGNVIAFAGSAVVMFFLPASHPVPVPHGRPARWGVALHDWPFVLMTVLDGVMSIQYKVLTVAIPLWLFAFTTAPRWLVAGTVIVNTVIVILFQVRASRNVDTPRAGGAAYRRAGVAFLLSCSLISLTAGLAAWAATALLMTAIVAHAIGELWHAAGGFEVSFALAHEHMTGQYLGVFGLGSSLADAVGPGLLIALCVSWGPPGWFVVGSLFALTGLAVPHTIRWAQRHHMGASSFATRPSLTTGG
jgi:hypothetical protein